MGTLDCIREGLPMKPILVLMWSVLLAGPLQAACLSDAEITALLGYMARREPAPDLPAMTAQQAHCTRAKLVARLGQERAVVGYKVGLTNPTIRRMLKGDEPAWGVLFEGMLLPGGTQLSARFGARPTVEADLLVRVRSSAIHQARTPMEVLMALDQVIPYIELPDMVVATPLKLDAQGMAALNMSARHGVVGTPIAVPDDVLQRQAMLDALASMTVVLADGDGKPLGKNPGADLMGHPLNAALWLVQALAREGITVQPGQYLSLGSFPPVLPTRAGLKVVLDYQGLPGAQPVWVQFTP